ncbi:MAG: AraC family transcriptional regulator [Oscillospiraceae bacterium]|jgi:AraC-like DNA-binding protein|nr:AraC family transcriptional regulator [Oscillospiraceae bacterium]
MKRVIFKGVLDGIVVDRIVRDEEFSMPSMHFHPEFEIYYLYDGTRDYFINDRIHTVGKGSLVIIDTLKIHRTSTPAKLAHDRILIELTAEPFATFFNSLCDTPLDEIFRDLEGVWLLCDDERFVIEGILGDIEKEFLEQKTNHRMLVMMKIAELLLFIERLKEAGRGDSSLPRTLKHTQINSVTDYISSNYSSALTLDIISKHFYISKSYLCRIFKEVTGLTVKEYIHMFRIKKAQDLLANGNMRISEISESLGYGTTTYFERMFRRYMETSPLKYRKKTRLIQQKVRERKREDTPVSAPKRG